MANPQTTTDETTKSLYDRDFLMWLETTAQLLRQKKFEQLDLDNLIEEIESRARSEKRELYNRLTLLLTYLLKWKYQPDKRSNSWISTIREQRRQIGSLLADSPSLKNRIEEIFNTCYQDAVEDASLETGLSKDIFLERCPFSLANIFAPNFLPD
ncbi:MAG: DUF29 domain-containing protein [Hydrococcus sp. C42_A2020_068]|uniref:DUF29 domain-containing protein n=1 Tax=Pleurocapsa sp. PCC 7327 TaxID=118163 RepID=UPI00029FE63F|nr:DUF29 domain-containing protein [Pleurocapsa sp. PCC 7327]AFY76257.1 protein of unknown function DUF29 [Pleurocapsa sp. PCC 7327]MBF2018931.1 DUF29 domain-containing protein [Hydrococcus sp. C42_A2020_068]